MVPSVLYCPPMRDRQRRPHIGVLCHMTTRRGVYPHGIVCRNTQRGATHTYDDWEYIWVGSRAGRRQLSSRRSQARGSTVVVLQESLEHDHRHPEQTAVAVTATKRTPTKSAALAAP